MTDPLLDKAFLDLESWELKRQVAPPQLPISYTQDTIVSIDLLKEIMQRPMAFTCTIRTKMKNLSHVEHIESQHSLHYIW